MTNTHFSYASVGQRIVPPKVSTAQYRGGGGGVVVVNQNPNNDFPSTPSTWNIPSQYSHLHQQQPQQQQQNRNELMPGDPNMFTSNIFVPVEAAVSPPTMAASEAPTNWHEPAAIKPGTACIE